MVTKLAMEKLFVGPCQPLTRHCPLGNTSILVQDEDRTGRAEPDDAGRKVHAVCLGIKEGSQSPVTVAASEPRPRHPSCSTFRPYDLVEHCETFLQLPGMSKGDRGEPIVWNITTNALDSLMFNCNHSLSAQRHTSKLSLAQATMRPSETLAHEDHNKTFAETFKDARLYITNFTKVYDYELLSAEFLLKCIVRVVAIVRADNQCSP